MWNSYLRHNFRFVKENQDFTQHVHQKYGDKAKPPTMHSRSPIEIESWDLKKLEKSAKLGRDKSAQRAHDNKKQREQGDVERKIWARNDEPGMHQSFDEFLEWVARNNLV